jgi:thioredoxin reductase (NADPH)
MEQVELLILGAGPAGLSAAIYAARAGIKVQVIGCTPKFAGDYDIDNYFGFPETISGRELQERGVKQAARFGAEASCEQVLGIHQEEDGTFKVKTEQREIKTCAVILATGVSRVRPGIKNLPDYEGKGVSYCVSCDGFFFKNKKVVVLGESLFAANQALDLKHYTPDVTICTNGKQSNIGPELQQALELAGIPIVTQKVVRLEGQNGLERLSLEDGKTLEAYGLFVALGEAGAGNFALTLGLERRGEFIVTDNEQKTNIPGVFAAGDCTGGFMQISVAVGEGAKAGHAAINFIRTVCRKKQEVS